MNDVTEVFTFVRLPAVNGWDVYQSQNSEFWMRDIELGRRAGLTRPRNIRRTITKAIERGHLFDAAKHHRSHVSDGPAARFRNVSSKSIANQPKNHRSHVSDGAIALYYESLEPVTLGSGAVRQVPTFFLNPRGVLRVLRNMRSKLEDDPLDELIEGALRAFDDFKSGRVSVPVAPPPPSEQRIRQIFREEFSAYAATAFGSVPEFRREQPPLLMPPLPPLDKPTQLYDALVNRGYSHLRVTRVVKALLEYIDEASIEELVKKGENLLLRGNESVTPAPKMPPSAPDKPTVLKDAMPASPKDLSKSAEIDAVQDAPISSEDLVSKYSSCFDGAPMLPTCRLLMLALLQCADKETGIATVRHKVLMKMTGLGHATIYKHRHVLVTLGYIQVMQQVDDLGSQPTMIKLNFHAFPQPKRRA